jgi:hypothetical protein
VSTMWNLVFVISLYCFTYGEALMLNKSQCTFNQNILLSTTLALPDFCYGHREFYNMFCNHVYNQNNACYCDILSFNNVACFNNICICQTQHEFINNISIEFEIGLISPFVLNVKPKWIKNIEVRDSWSNIEMQIPLIIGVSLAVLMIIMILIGFYNLYKKYVGYEKVEIVQTANTEKEARTHVSVVTSKVQAIS